MNPRIGSLCSGYGGLDLAVQAVYGGETAWVSDIDKGACKILAHRYPDVPNLGDFTATDWATVEPVDILTAGFPCQPVSNAGKRLGDEDERWLWDDVARAVGELRPGLVVLENVRGLLTAGSGRLFGLVLGALAGLGYDAQWHGLRASDVGAPHNRFRVFIVATDAQRGGRDGWAREARRGSVGRTAVDRRAEGALLPTPRSSDGDKGLRTTQGARAEYARKGDGSDLATVLKLLPTPAVNDMGEGKTVEQWDEWTAAMKAKHGNGNGHGPSLSIELARLKALQGAWGKYANAVHVWELIHAQAPPPSEPVLVREWMMGLPAGWVTDVPGITRNEALKALGNGVVPQQAAEALRLMATWQVAA